MNLRIGAYWTGLPLALALAIAPAVHAQNETTPPQPNRLEKSTRTAGEIASQPARDIGASKTEVPPVLQRAIAAPYGATGTASCRQIRSGIASLSAVLGPDFAAGTTNNENRASKIAEAGGKTVVNSILPFRGLVREISGAAPAQRRLNAAIDAGYARRGFLRGLTRAKGCKLG
jgi:hypothetical protein